MLDNTVLIAVETEPVIVAYFLFHSASLLSRKGLVAQPRAIRAKGASIMLQYPGTVEKSLAFEA